jgi:transmembrane sensor
MEPIKEQLFLEILAKYNAGNASKEEVAYLEAYYNIFELADAKLTPVDEAQLKACIKARIDAKLNVRSRIINISLKRFAAAAVILLSLTAGLYFTLFDDSRPHLEDALVNDHAPGSTKATLTLGNGQVITLDDAATGKIAEQAGTNVLNTAGRIMYTGGTADAGTVAENHLQNTIATPKGGQYQLVLADGTKVWLNSASSITYPTAFSKGERLVTLRGEAYFEVAKNKNAPFRVKSANQLIEVLGTHFNVNAYSDENATMTTLLEGSVKVSTRAGNKLLKPGEQSRVSLNTSEIILSNANTGTATAWKNGVFSFENQDIQSIMRQISRWYDVEVIYASALPEEKFSREISRNSKLSEVCKILELNNLSFNISGRKVIVAARQ